MSTPSEIRWAALMLLSILISGCSVLAARYQPPEMTLVDVKPLPSGNLEQRFSMTFRVLNPNEITLPIRGLSYTVRLQGQKFATGATPQELDIAPFSESAVTVEVSTSLLRTAGVILELMRDRPESIDYDLEAKISTNIPLLGTVRVEKAGQFQTRKPVPGG